MTDQTYTIEFFGRPGDRNDITAQREIRAAGGEVTSAGTFLMSTPMQRDIEFTVPSDQAESLIAGLRRLGFDPKAKVQ